MENANYASTDVRPKVWGVKHGTTNEVLETHSELKVLHDKYKGDDYVFVKVPKKLA